MISQGCPNIITKRTPKNKINKKMKFFYIIIFVLKKIYIPKSVKNCAKRIFKIKGNESSAVYVSLENRFSILPKGIESKKEMFVWKYKLINKNHLRLNLLNNYIKSL